MKEYYQLPLALDRIRHREELPKSPMRLSVAQHLHLLCTTAFGELRCDKHFGTVIWDFDFDNLTSENKSREQIKQSITRVIAAYEPRLQQVRVEVLIRQVELNVQLSGHHVKKQMDIMIRAVMAATNEPFEHLEQFFAGPLSY